MRAPPLLILWTLWVCACSETDDPKEDDTASTTPTSTSSSTSSSPTSTGTTGTTSSTPTSPTSTATDEVFDCASVTKDPVEVRLVEGPRAGRGLTFNEAGDMLIGVHEPHIAQSTYKGPLDVLYPSFGGMEQIDRLPDGDYVVSDYDAGALVRVTPDGIQSLIAADVRTYLVRVGPDGMIYTTTGVEVGNNTVNRTDPNTGVTEEVVRGADGDPPFVGRVIDFSRDLSKMYIGTYGSGAIYVVDLDEDLNPTTTPVQFARSVGGWHDGIGVDACGYLWVASYDDQSTYRVSPDGKSSVRVLRSTFAEGHYGHGVFWGTGEGGFRDDALYLPQPYNRDTVMEAIIRVPSRTFPGTVINAP